MANTAATAIIGKLGSHLKGLKNVHCYRTLFLSEHLIDQLVDLSDEVQPPMEPTDPAVHRLFPNAYGDDDAEAAADFRRFTEQGLRQLKAARLATVERLVAEFGVPGAEAKTVEITDDDDTAVVWHNPWLAMPECYFTNGTMEEVD